MAPFINGVVERPRRQAIATLRDNGAGAAPIQLGDNPVSVERTVGDQTVEFDIRDQRRHPHGIVALAGKQLEFHQVTKRIG